MKTAVCFTGIGRSIFALDQAYVFRNLVETAIDCWEDRDVYYILGDANQTVTEGIKQLCSGIKGMNLVIVPQTDLDLTGVAYEKAGWIKETMPSEQSLSKFLNKRRILGEVLKASGKRYDRVVISRDDVIYPRPLSEDVADLDLNKIWIPNWGHWNGGYNDRFAVCNHDLALTYCEMWNHRHEVKRIHIESFFRYCMDKYIGEENIGMFFAEFQRIRPSGRYEEKDNDLSKQAPYDPNNHTWKNFVL